MKHETDAARAGVEAAAAVRRGGKSRGAYLQWLDNEIKAAKESYEQAPNKLSKQHTVGHWEALARARKSFTDEFYPK
jgi:hypothetical protein